jgi:hypothetical protein
MRKIRIQPRISSGQSYHGGASLNKLFCWQAAYKCEVLQMHSIKLFSLSYVFDKTIDYDLLVNLKISRI